jgi:hypothetical protein
MRSLKKRRRQAGGLPLPNLPDELPRKVKQQLRESYSSPVVATECGHLASGVAIVWLGDDWAVTDMRGMSAPTYCGACLSAMAIRCGWCGQAIFIGDPVTLYSRRDGGLPELPERAVIYDQARNTLVGCLGWNCAETGADRAGFWLPDSQNPGQGYVKLYESLYSRAARKGVVIVEDLSRP